MWADSTLDMSADASNPPLRGSRAAGTRGHSPNDLSGSRSVHGHYVERGQSPAPMHYQALKCPLNVLIAGGVTEGLIGHIGRMFEQIVGSVLVHMGSMPSHQGFSKSHFPIPDEVVHGAIVSVASANKYVRLRHA